MASTTAEQMIKALAVALVSYPRATLAELAALSGVSRATLYRFCPRREELLTRVMAHAMDVHVRITQNCLQAEVSTRQAFLDLVDRHIEEREFTTFAFYYWTELQTSAAVEMARWEACQDSLDAFFLRGQREGVFRLDVPTAAFSDFFYYGLASVTDSERRGRLARHGMRETVLKLLLSGMQESPDSQK